MRKLTSSTIWTIIVLLSAAAAALVFYTGFGAALRPVVLFWFLLIIPGMAFVRLLYIVEVINRWTLAVGLSLAIDSIVAIVMLYSGSWRVEYGLAALLAISIIGALIPSRRQTVFTNPVDSTGQPVV